MTTSVHITFDDEAVPTYVKGAPSPAAAAAEGASKKNPPSESSADADAVAAKIAAADASASRREKDGKHDKKKSNADGGGRDDDAKEKEDAADDKKDAKLSPLERCEKRIRHAKRATRSELSVSGGEWQKNGYYLDASVLSTANLGDDVPRISAREVSKQEFIERFEKPRLPCIITEAMDGWRANETWTIDALKEKFGSHRFKVGSDDDGYAVRLKFSHIHHYLTDETHAKDDSPLYIFDGSFGDKEGSMPLLDDYAVPEYFAEDLFQHVGEKRRPPYRWVVIGPPRSGSSVHVDPLATSAWNALISGHKRWCLFPPTPGLEKAHLKPKGIGLDGESVTWFNKMYPRTRGAAWRDAGRPPPMDAVQRPGEIMYVPDGWWHAVLNLDHTVAVTQNVVTTSRFAKAWRMTKRGRPKMSAKWLEKLRLRRPDLAAVADAQPRRGEESAHEVTSSSSSSSSSTETSTDDEAEKREEEKKEARERARAAVNDDTLRRMAAERRERCGAGAERGERGPGSPSERSKSKSSKSKSESKSKSKSKSKSESGRKRSRVDVTMEDAAK